MFKAAKIIIPLTSMAAVATSNTKINNDTKRSFYEDEKDVVPVPGTVTPASGPQLEALGSNKIVDGISVRSPSTLQSFFKSSRESVLNLYNKGRQSIDEWYATYNAKEKSVTSTVSQLHAKHEDLLPSSIYIVIAALSGNVFARQRSILAKISFPVVFGLAGFRYFLPETFARTMGFAWKLEKENLPQLASSQEAAVVKSQQLASSIEENVKWSRKSVYDSTQSIKGSIASATGLNLDEEVTKK